MGRQNNRLYAQIPAIKLRGFTLIELLVVIAVLGVLVSVLIYAIDPLKQLQRARDTKRKANIAQIQQGLELYRADKGTYPDQSRLNACGASASLVEGSVTYLRGIPCDPSTDNPYGYDPTPDSSPTYSYTLVACLENIADKERDQSNDTCPGDPVSYTRRNP